jgi:hypothetical protein
MLVEKSADDSNVEFQERVRCRAYEIYLEHGGQDGHALDDWLQAKSELVQRGVKLKFVPDGVELI